ncbi:MAG: hypothetical protein EBY39_13800 [Flavobacteriia bacterium]|nr:hypothetical protein [Flavobacteriia bacterium]
MKRNEMIERLRCFLSEEQGYKEDWSYAEGIVNFLVSQGMQPPPYTFKHEVVNPTTVNTISVTNYEWEDEG